MVNYFVNPTVILQLFAFGRPLWRGGYEIFQLMGLLLHLHICTNVLKSIWSKHVFARYVYLLGIMFLLSVPGKGQDFFLNSSAYQLNDTCWQLTSDELWQAGSIWNEEKVDLTQSFQVIMRLFFGCKDEQGADGIVFGLQPVSTSVGVEGEGIGFQGVIPSLGIEFDTYQNTNLGDPFFDHIAVVRNGNMNHATANTLAGPVQASATDSNIEDCNWHTLRVNWDAVAKTLEVWFDCELRLTYSGDIVQEIFGGDPLVYWGFTSATGGLSNLHQVCFAYTSFLQGFDDVVICPGGQYQLQLSGGQTYQWQPAYGLSDPTAPNPVAAPDTTTTYYVKVVDECNIPFYDTITVSVDGDTVFFDLGPDTSICVGSGYVLDATAFGQDTVTYQWSHGSFTPAVEPTVTGLYSVTVAVDQYCVSDDRAYITVVPLPYLDDWADTVACVGDSVWLEGSSPGNPDYWWEDGVMGPQRVVSEPGTYVLTARNLCGEAQTKVRIDFEDCRQVFFPNVFSPNDDGFNDYFYPQDNGDVWIINQLRIFDRWGEEVYQVRDLWPNQPEYGWDGRLRGKPMPMGVYVWQALIVFRDGYTTWRVGSVLLLR